MTDKPDGGPAFPASYATPTGPVAYDDNHGMSLRDYFAGQALAGLSVKLGEFFFLSGQPGDCVPDQERELVRLVYSIADSMMRERDL
jgi:hypothetical protein